MEGMVTRGSVQSALTCNEESYCVGDVIIASSVVIGRGVMLRADPGCSITIRDGVCLGAGVIIHASQGSIELHQGACLAGGVILVGAGKIGQHVCVGAGATLINPCLSDGSMISAHCLWGDESRSVSEEDPSAQETDSSTPHFKTVAVDVNHTQSEKSDAREVEFEVSSQTVKSESQTVNAKTVIGRSQFESMLKQMFPDREAFKRSQLDST